MTRRTAHLDDQGDALRRAKAVAVPTRAVLLELLRRADAPRTAADLAAEVGVHHTAVRQHMAVLVDAGLVGSLTLPPEGRGRPRTGYRALTSADPYQHLAAALAEALGEGLGAHEAGRRLGAAVTPSPDGPLATLVAEAERLGFRPVLRTRAKRAFDLVLQSCPFADVAAVAPDTVCALHRGVADGIAGRVGGLEIDDLRVVDPHRGGCRLLGREVAAT